LRGQTFGENGSANEVGPHLVPEPPLRPALVILTSLTNRSAGPLFNLALTMKYHHGHPEHTDSTAPTDTLQTLSHEDITQCARELWAQQGCPEGRDEAIWLEAESRLLASRRGASRSLPAVGSVR
jgi:hypothetical protein